MLKALAVAPGTTALQAIEHSGILQDFPEIDTNSDSIGVFSQVLGTKGLDEPAVYQLQPMDRVEIYRPLIIDPKQARANRAAKAAKG